MTSEQKSYKDKIKLRYLNKKRQASLQKSNSPNILSNNSKTSKNREESSLKKINAKYLKEEIEVGNCLKLRHSVLDDENDEQMKKIQKELSFFVDPFSTILHESEDETGLVQKTPDSSEKSGSHSSRSNESATHLASSYIQHESSAVVEKFELTRITFDEDDLLFNPRSEKPEDENWAIIKRKPEKEGFYIQKKPKVKDSNRNLMLNRIIEDGSKDLLDDSGDFIDFRRLIDKNLYRLKCDRNFTPIYVPPTPMAGSARKIIYEKKFLKIFINQLAFDQHPLFTSEHFAAKTLENLVDEFLKRQGVDLTKKLQVKLNKLRESKTGSSEGREKSSKSVKQEHLALHNKIKAIRDKLHKEEQYERLLLKNILENWKSLKHIRQQQSHSLTSIALKIHKQDGDLENDHLEWQKRQDLELDELIQEEFDRYNVLKLKYKQHIRDLRDENCTDDVEPMKKPKKPDVEKIVQQMKEKLGKTSRSLSEPHISVSLSQVEPPRTTKAKQFLKKVTALSYTLKLSIDGAEVGTTKVSKLNERFLVDINSVFVVELTKKLPENIKIIVYEHGKISSKISEIIIPIPDDEEIYQECQLIPFDFSSKKVVKKTLKKAGNSKKGATSRIISRNGKVGIKAGWTHEDSMDEVIDDQGKPSRPKKFVLSQETLKKWYDECLLNPMDPEAGYLMKIIRKQEGIQLESICVEGEGEMFRFQEDSLAFCTEEEFNKNERFNILTARYQNQLHFKNKKFIPQLEREIEFDHKHDQSMIDDSIGMDPIDIQRYRGRKYLKKVYEIITNHCENLNRDKLNTNILVGDQFPTFGSISMAFLEMLGPKRPLKPIRRTTSSRTSCKVSEIYNFNIVINVVRAFGVPVRIDETTGALNSRKSSNFSNNKFANFKTVSVRPYVAMSLKDKTVRTTTAEGTNPTFNEQLSLPLNTHSDHTKKFLTIDLFDEHIEDLIDNVTEVYQRISSKWLGQLKIPISTLYANQRIEGTFEINTPQILMGYSKPKFAPVDQTSIFIESLPDMTKKTHISFFISLEPGVETQDFISNGLECIELENIEMHIKLWFEQMKLEYPARAKNPLITLLNGKRACITRLLSPLGIPFEKTEYAEFLIRRFVSLIPTYQENSYSVCSKLNGIWLSNNHVLSVLSASSKDLGVLLTCYYLELGYDSWLILGNSLSYSETCFVLIKDMGEYYIIDPTTGKRFSCKDIYCPLEKVYGLVNPFNFWANIQRENRVFMTHFDVNKGMDWRPLFNRVSDIPKEPVHDLNFRYQLSYGTGDLQKLIQSKIVKKISAWRSHRKTVWNRYVSENLRNILTKLEDDVCYENESEEHVELLNSLFSNYKATGYTINSNYTNLSAIVADIKSSGIHLNIDNKVEFAVSVYVKEYVNNVLSIWIFLMSLVPKI